MSNLENLKAVETRLEALAATGNTVAGSLASYLLIVISAVSEISEGAGIPDLTAFKTQINDALVSQTGILNGMQLSASAHAERLAAAENAVSILSSRLQKFEDALGALTPAPVVPSPAAPVDPGLQPAI